MKKEIEIFNLKIGDIFTEQKSRELIKYLNAKDKELIASAKLVRQLFIKNDRLKKELLK